MATVAPGRDRPSSRVVTVPVRTIGSWAREATGTASARKTARPGVFIAAIILPAREGCQRRERYTLAPMRSTKIVATIGPASRDRAVLERLVQAGLDVVRLNFSHGEHAQHLEVLKLVREISSTSGRPIAILQDLSGPKIRTGRLKGGGPVEMVKGRRIVITTDETIEGTAERISTTYDPLPKDVSPGDRILLDDGNLELRVLSSSLTEVECEVVHGGPLKPNKGMNLPGVRLSTPALTEKDRVDLAFGIKNGVDYVALSFVRQAADVEECKALIKSMGASTP